MHLNKAIDLAQGQRVLRRRAKCQGYNRRISATANVGQQVLKRAALRAGVKEGFEMRGMASLQ